MTARATAESAPSRFAVIAGYAAVYLIWGSTYLAIRIAIETLPPYLMTAVRFLVAGAVLWIWLSMRGRERTTTRQWITATIIGGLLLLGGNGTVVWAEQFVASGLAALLVAMVPLWMVILEWLGPGGTRPTRPVMIGLAVGLVGVGILVGQDGGLDTGRVPLIPALALLFASGIWAAGSLYSRIAPLPRSPALGTSMQMIAGGFLILMVALLRGEPARFDVSAVSLRSLLALGYLILFGAIIAFSAYIWLLRVSSPAKVSTYAYVNPVVAVFLGWLIAAEPLTPRVGVATLLVVSAVFLVTVGRKGSSNTPEKENRGETPRRETTQARSVARLSPRPPRRPWWKSGASESEGLFVESRRKCAGDSVNRRGFPTQIRRKRPARSVARLSPRPPRAGPRAVAELSPGSSATGSAARPGGGHGLAARPARGRRSGRASAAARAGRSVALWPAR